MGLKSMVSRYIPVVRYVREVREGTNEQKDRADKLREAVMPVAVNLRHMYEKNHFAELVDKTFLGRP